MLWPTAVILAAAPTWNPAASGQAASGHRVVSPISGTDSLLFDDTGALIHTWPSRFKVGMALYLKDDGNLLRSIVTAEGPSGTGGGVQELGLDGTVLWDFRYDTGGVLAHHDIEPMPNGNVLLLAWKDLSREEAIAAGRNPALISETTRPDHIVEVRPTGPSSGEIVWKWSVMDHVIQDFDAQRSNFGDVAAHPARIDINFPAHRSGGELNHLNSIDYDPTHDWILLSSYYQDEIWIIDHSTTTAEAAGSSGGRRGKGGDLLYRWGNPASYRAGAAGAQTLFGPHAARFLPQDDGSPPHVLVFNNKSSPRSAVLELTPPFENDRFVRFTNGTFGPPAPIWSYTASDFDSDLMASAERLPNGNTLICSSMQIRVFEIDPAGRVVWEIGIDELNGYPFHATYTPRTLWVEQRRSAGEVRWELIAGTRRAGEFFQLAPPTWDTLRNGPNPRILPWHVAAGIQGFLDEAGRASATIRLPARPRLEWLGGIRATRFRTFDLERHRLTSTSNTTRLAGFRSSG